MNTLKKEIAFKLKDVMVEKRRTKQKSVVPVDNGTMIKDTRDVRVLHNEHIRELFNDKKHNICNHLKDNEPIKNKKLKRNMSDASNAD